MDKTVPEDQGLTWAFTDKPVTPWGGLRVVHEMLLRMNLREGLNASGLPEPGSNRGYDPATMIESFLVCVWSPRCRRSRVSFGASSKKTLTECSDISDAGSGRMSRRER